MKNKTTKTNIIKINSGLIVLSAIFFGLSKTTKYESLSSKDLISEVNEDSKAVKNSHSTPYKHSDSEKDAVIAGSTIGGVSLAGGTKFNGIKLDKKRKKE